MATYDVTVKVEYVLQVEADAGHEDYVRQQLEDEGAIPAGWEAEAVGLEVLTVDQRTNEAGQGLAEYALILALVAILAVAALLFLGGNLADVLSDIGAAIAER